MAGILRGGIHWADLNPVIGSEQGGLRPVSNPRSGWNDAFKTKADRGDDRIKDEAENILHSWDEDELKAASDCQAWCFSKISTTRISLRLLIELRSLDQSFFDEKQLFKGNLFNGRV